VWVFHKFVRIPYHTHFLSFLEKKQEVIVKGLAESRTFQRMALKTHTTLNELEKRGTQHLESTLNEFNSSAAAGDHLSSASGNKSGPPKAPLRGVSGFVAAFFKEVRKDITGMK
jgi:hypothetical protein